MAELSETIQKKLLTVYINDPTIKPIKSWLGILCA